MKTIVVLKIKMALKKYNLTPLEPIIPAVQGFGVLETNLNIMLTSAHYHK